MSKIFNGLQVLIPLEHDEIVNGPVTGTSDLNNSTIDIKYKEFSDPIFHSAGQLYMSEHGIQQFICLNTTQVKLDGILTPCQPNDTMTVRHSVAIGNITYLVESRFLAEVDFHQIVKNFSMKKWFEYKIQSVLNQQPTKQGPLLNNRMTELNQLGLEPDQFEQ